MRRNWSAPRTQHPLRATMPPRDSTSFPLLNSTVAFAIVAATTLAVFMAVARISSAQPPQPSYRTDRITKSLRAQQLGAGLRQARVAQINGQPEITPPGPSPVSTYRLPLKSGPTSDQLQITNHNGLVTVIVRQADLRDVLAGLAEAEQLNIVSSKDVTGDISITLRDVPVEEALSAIVAISGCTWTRAGNIIQVTSISNTLKLAPAIQGRQVRVITLDFVSGDDLLPSLKTMLSPVGTANVSAIDSEDNRKTKESLVVEDVPEYIERIDQYVAQMDIPPRQVMIQVHVLQVNLQEDNRHGINFNHVMKFSGQSLSLQMQGFAAANAPQAFFAQLSASNLTGLIEALKVTTDAKTLASPRVLALNGQLARIQVGEKLGYRVLTNTQTSTLEDIKFMDVGVVLEVTPTISRDGRVLLDINPKVSTGQVNSDTGLPQEATSEVMTNVLLHDGQGVVIGGLIQEENTDNQSKVIGLGDLYLVGSLFKRRRVNKTRKEIIFFLVPKVISSDCCDPVELEKGEQAQTPLFHGPLHPNPRPWEPAFPEKRPFARKHVSDHLPVANERAVDVPIPNERLPLDPGLPPILDPLDAAPLPPGTAQQVPAPRQVVRQVSTWPTSGRRQASAAHSKPPDRIKLRYPDSLRRR